MHAALGGNNLFVFVNETYQCPGQVSHDQVCPRCLGLLTQAAGFLGLGPEHVQRVCLGHPGLSVVTILKFFILFNWRLQMCILN